MIRILHYGMSSSMGGIEAFIMNVYRNIDRNKIQFDFLKSETTIQFEDEILEMGGKIYDIPDRRSNIVEFYNQIDKHFKSHPEHQILHAHINTCSCIEPMIIAKKNRRKVIVHSHNEWKGNKITTQVLHQLNKARLKKNYDIAFACSEVAGKYNFGKEKFNIIKNGIPLNKYLYNENIRKKVREEFNINNDLVIGHIGRFCYQKNHKFIIDVLVEMLKTNVNIKVLLVGDGEEKPYIQDIAKKLGIEKNIIFAGIRNDVEKLLQAMDIFIFPSYFEGLPVTLIEAQASGIQIYASENISDEVNLSEVIKFMSITKGAEYWSKEILSGNMKNHRVDTKEAIIRAGYDISSTVEELSQRYQEMGKVQQ